MLICFFLIWATEVVSSLFSLTPLSDPLMISHSRLTELQTTLNSFYLYFHWLSSFWSNALSKTFHLNLPPTHHYVHSPYPRLQNSICLSPSYCTPSGICIYFLLFGMFLHLESSNLSFKTQFKHFILCEVSINSSGQIYLPSPSDPKIYGHLRVTLLTLAFKCVFSTRWWDSNYKGQYLTYSHMPSKWHIQCCWINLSNIYHSTNIYRMLVVWQVLD